VLFQRQPQLFGHSARYGTGILIWFELVQLLHGGKINGRAVITWHG
jgi:hypothetical protein